MTQTIETNGIHLRRADEIDDLLKAVQKRLIPFIRAADDEIQAHKAGESAVSSAYVSQAHPEELEKQLPLSLPNNALGAEGLLTSLEAILEHSVNTFSPGFLDKLYAATNAPGIVSELILACLNTNLHVYHVSPALSLIERATTKALASLFGFNGPRAGGISVQGGSASNMTSIVIARNTLYPETKVHGNAAGGRKLILFTSAHGHYSIEKAAQACGFGSAAVVSVPVDSKTGAMSSKGLEQCVIDAKANGGTPFYINATAGTTVLGSYDPFAEIAEVAKRYGCWMHVDGSWGGSFIFSDSLRAKMAGVEMADSIAINPHKMLGVPVTCSFLLGKDLETFQKANTLKAAYLFHGEDDEEEVEREWTAPVDLADLTLQCGRRGDSLKLFLSWQYYGTKGYGKKIDNAYAVAKYFANLVNQEPDLVLVSEQTPPCLQMCFFFAPGGKLLYGKDKSQIEPAQSSQFKSLDLETRISKMNGRVTVAIADALVAKGFMVDFSPALEGQTEVGRFLRAVVNIQTSQETIHRLVSDIVELGRGITQKLRDSHKPSS